MTHSNDPLDGLAVLAELVAPSPARAFEYVCFELGGEGSRRACAVLRDAGVRIAQERGDQAVSAALGAAAAGARVLLFASGAATTQLARATREAQRVGVVVTGIVLSHGDDIGAVLPAADGADLAALASARAERWVVSSSSELRAWLLERARALVEFSAACAVCAMDLRSVAMLRATPVALETENGASSALSALAIEGPAGGEVVLISCGAGAKARIAAKWLRREGVSARSVEVRRFETGEDAAALRAALTDARRVIVHDLADRSALSAIACACAATGGAKVERLVREGAVCAVDFCDAVAQAKHRRAALAAASHALRVQLVGPPSSRAMAVDHALDAFALAGLLAWAERVEPTHAMFTIDVGAAQSVGSSGWLAVVPGLPVRAPIEPALGAAAMVIDAGQHSSLLSSADVSARDQAALVVAIALVELELRGQSAQILALEAALSKAVPADPLAWGEVRSRADHLRSLR